MYDGLCSHYDICRHFQRLKYEHTFLWFNRSVKTGRNFVFSKTIFRSKFSKTYRAVWIDSNKRSCKHCENSTASYFALFAALTSSTLRVALTYDKDKNSNADDQHRSGGDRTSCQLNKTSVFDFYRCSHTYHDHPEYLSKTSTECIHTLFELPAFALTFQLEVIKRSIHFIHLNVLFFYAELSSYMPFYSTQLFMKNFAAKHRPRKWNGGKCVWERNEMRVFSCQTLPKSPFMMFFL